MHACRQAGRTVGPKILPTCRLCVNSWTSGCSSSPVARRSLKNSDWYLDVKSSTNSLTYASMRSMQPLFSCFVLRTLHSVPEMQNWILHACRASLSCSPLLQGCASRRHACMRAGGVGGQERAVQWPGPGDSWAAGPPCAWRPGTPQRSATLSPCPRHLRQQSQAMNFVNETAAPMAEASSAQASQRCLPQSLRSCQPGRGGASRASKRYVGAHLR